MKAGGLTSTSSCFIYQFVEVIWGHHAYRLDVISIIHSMISITLLRVLTFDPSEIRESQCTEFLKWVVLFLKELFHAIKL